MIYLMKNCKLKEKKDGIEKGDSNGHTLHVGQWYYLREL